MVNDTIDYTKGEIGMTDFQFKTYLELRDKYETLRCEVELLRAENAKLKLENEQLRKS